MDDKKKIEHRCPHCLQTIAYAVEPDLKTAKCFHCGKSMVVGRIFDDDPVISFTETGRVRVVRLKSAHQDGVLITLEETIAEYANQFVEHWDLVGLSIIPHNHHEYSLAVLAFQKHRPVGDEIMNTLRRRM